MTKMTKYGNGKLLSEVEGTEKEVVKEFEFEVYRAGWLLSAAHRCYFKSCGHHGLAEDRSTLEGTGGGYLVHGEKLPSGGGRQC